jgi:hypothetical protein
MTFRIVTPFLALALLVGCAGSSGPDRVDSAGTPLARESISVVEFSSAAAVVEYNEPHEAFGMMVAEEIAAALRKQGHQAEAVLAGANTTGDIIVTGGILEIQAGSRSLRYWIGFGAGSAEFAVAGEVSRAGTGDQLGNFSHERWSGTGMFGGNSVTLVQKCVRAVGADVAKMIETGAYTHTSP